MQRLSSRLQRPKWAVLFTTAGGSGRSKLEPLSVDELMIAHRPPIQTQSLLWDSGKTPPKWSPAIPAVSCQVLWQKESQGSQHQIPSPSPDACSGWAPKPTPIGLSVTAAAVAVIFVLVFPAQSAPVILSDTQRLDLCSRKARLWSETCFASGLNLPVLGHFNNCFFFLKNVFLHIYTLVVGHVLFHSARISVTKPTNQVLITLPTRPLLAI